MALPEDGLLWDAALLLPWWQRCCLDVYAALAAALLVAGGGIRLAARAAWRGVRRLRKGSAAAKRKAA